MADLKSGDDQTPRAKPPEKALPANFVRTITKLGKCTDGHGLFLQVDGAGILLNGRVARLY